MAVYVLVCDEVNYDATTGTCSAPYYAPQPSLLPDLSIPDAMTISVAILALWAVGFGIRSIRRSLHNT
jgi:hypothetical protein